MTAEDWLHLLFWAFTPAYIFVAAFCVCDVWRKARAKGDQRFPWYWAIVAVAYYLTFAIPYGGTILLWPTSSRLTVMLLITAGVWLLTLRAVWGWWKARRAKPSQPD